MGGKFTIWKRYFRQVAGLSFAAGVLAQAGMIYDKVIYIDPKRGADGNDGSDWAHAVKTINGACDQCYGGDSTSETLARGRGAFAFVYRAFNTGGNEYPTQQIIDVDGVHLIGAGEWYGAGSHFESAFMVNGNKLTADAELTGLRSTYAGLLVKAESVVVEGIKFVLRDATNAPYMVAFSDQHPVDDATHGRAGIGAGMFNCDLQGNSGGSGTEYGVGLCGTESPALAGNRYHFFTEAITLGSGPIRYVNGGIFKDEVIMGCGYGIRNYNGDVVENQFDNIRIMQKGLYGMTFVKGIDMTVGTYNYFTNCFVNHTTKNTAYVPGTNNWFHRCWFGNTGAAATEYDGA
jgi:hypothetical protein